MVRTRWSRMRSGVCAPQSTQAGIDEASLHGNAGGGAWDAARGRHGERSDKRTGAGDADTLVIRLGGDPSASPARSPPETRGSLWWRTGVDRSHYRRLLGRVLTGPDLSLHKLSSFSPAVTDTVQARSAPL
jgi:hypothetical protein